MTYALIAFFLFLIVLGIKVVLEQEIDLERIIPAVLVLVIGYCLVIGIDYCNKTSDKEIWSGKITKVKHEEEWDEWHPPSVETYTTTDSKGNTVTQTRTIPGYWEHHEAENYITTSDEGTFRVFKTPDGKRFSDSFVNSTKELEKYYPIGQATASTHIYVNKVQSSYSIFKNKEIDLNDYPDLFEYPLKQNKNYSINRLLGNFKNKAVKSKYLDSINSNLNDTDNPNNTENTKSYKQVNLILANFEDKNSDYGYALQDYWENGNKNDVVVTFGTDANGKPTWCYVFSWSDVEILKTDIREVVMSVEDINKEYNKTLDKISDLIEEKYKRREFAEFDYIQVELSMFSKVLLVIIFLASIFLLFFL